MIKIASGLDQTLLTKTANSLKAIGHPVRLAIVELLKDEKKLTVTQIYESIGLEQAVASQHLSILREKNILDSQRKGKHTFYFVKHPCVIEAIEMLISTHKD